LVEAVYVLLALKPLLESLLLLLIYISPKPARREVLLLKAQAAPNRGWICRRFVAYAPRGLFMVKPVWSVVVPAKRMPPVIGPFRQVPGAVAGVTLQYAAG